MPGGGTKYFMGQPQSKLYKTVEIKNKTNFDAFLNEWFVKGKNIIHLTLMWGIFSHGWSKTSDIRSVEGKKIKNIYIYI